jgi:hypothetical protein
MAASLVVLAGTGEVLAQEEAPRGAQYEGVTTGAFGSALTAQEREQAQAMIARAVAYLRSKQDEGSGGWSIPPAGTPAPTFPAITALVLMGMRGNDTVAQDDPAVTRGLEFILRSQQEDGGIYLQLLPSYNTSISISALARFDDPRAREAMTKAVEFLKTLQYGEAAVPRPGAGENIEVVARDHPFYGGWGYGRHGRPDLSNSQWAIAALRDAGVPDDDPAFQRALVFLQRMQMQHVVQDEMGDPKAVNEMPYAQASTQGGFVYATSVNRDRVGEGQSFAGEIAESLSGPPGSSAVVRLAPGTDGKARLLSKADVEAALAAAWAELPEVKGVESPPGYMVLLRATPDGRSGEALEVRGGLPPRRLAAVVREAAASAAKVASAEVQVTSAAVPAWQGVSRLRAYGSMTYSGFKSYLYANLAKDDPRVTAAVRWILSNYTLAENPGLGTDGYYYYLVVFGRAMEAYGTPVLPVRTESGAARSARWQADLVARLSELQNEDGSFRSVDDRWMEDNPVLITAYALNALQSAVKP